jgi:phosphoribosylformimino-5-aminoimidazole carboxamide ribotide isomerase
MKIIPVIDILGGRVVRAVGGRRNEYRPIDSPLIRSTDPSEVAAHLCETFDADTLYVADLDAITGQADSLGNDVPTPGRNVAIWIDAGVRTVDDVDRLLTCGVDRVIIGLETLPSPVVLAQIVRMAGADRIVFSLDLRGGEPICGSAGWGRPRAEQVADRAMDAGVTRVILLDLSRVGGRAGTGTLEIAQCLLKTRPDLEVVVGGGIYEIDQLRKLRNAGMWGALLATALHDGSISPADLQLFRAENG